MGGVDAGETGGGSKNLPLLQWSRTKKEGGWGSAQVDRCGLVVEEERKDGMTETPTFKKCKGTT